MLANAATRHWSLHLAMALLFEIHFATKKHAKVLVSYFFFFYKNSDYFAGNYLLLDFLRSNTVLRLGCQPNGKSLGI